jgi:hypothetical protein
MRSLVRIGGQDGLRFDSLIFLPEGKGLRISFAIYRGAEILSVRNGWPTAIILADTDEHLSLAGFEYGMHLAYKNGVDWNLPDVPAPGLGMPIVRRVRGGEMVRLESTHDERVVFKYRDPF